MGDDWFHNGTVRQEGTPSYTYEQEATRGNEEKRMDNDSAVAASRICRARKGQSIGALARR